MGAFSERLGRRPWTLLEEKIFDRALVMYQRDRTPERWSAIAARLPGRSAFEVWDHYQELAGDFYAIQKRVVEEIPDWWGDWYWSEYEVDGGESSEYGCGPLHQPQLQPRERKRGVPWTADEHRLFLEGLKTHGKGYWKRISKMVKSRTPTQIASHAQKYFIRQSQNNAGKESRRKRRRSIHDI